MTKRLLLVAFVAALLTAGTAFAQVKISGQIEYGVLSNFEDAPGQHWDNQLTFNTKIDEFNAGTIRFRARQSIDSAAYANPGIERSDAPLIDRFYVTTDVLGALGVKGLPVSWKMTNGFAYVSTADLSDGVSPFELADLDSDNFVAFGGGKQAVMSHVLTFADVWNLRFAIAPADFGAGNGGWFLSADGTVDLGSAQLTSEVVLSVNGGVSADKGNLIFAAKYAMDLGGMPFAIVPQFLYALDSDSPVQYAYSVSSSVGVSDMATISAGFLGLDGSEVNRMEAQVLLTPNKIIGFDIGAILNLDEDYYPNGAGETNILNELDVSAIINLGKTDFRLGYLYLGQEGFSSWINDDMSRIGRGASTLKQGGLYFEVTVAY
jgi:hypothetical protein